MPFACCSRQSNPLCDEVVDDLGSALGEGGTHDDAIEARRVRGAEASGVRMVREPENRDVGELLGHLVGVDAGDVDDDEVRGMDAVRRHELVAPAEESFELASEVDIDPSNQDRRHAAEPTTPSSGGPVRDSVDREVERGVESAYMRGLELIERREYFAAHEALEEAWRAAEPAERDFFQGLVHVAVAWYQAGRQNRVGCERQLEKAARRLRPFAPIHRGLDVEDVLVQLAAASYPILPPVRLRRAEATL